jgi:molybdopterin/thiamine biosynthesis adenylyltransferase
MPGKFHHEEIYRGAEVLQKLSEIRLTVCGAGALGSNLVETLLRQGFGRIRVIDKDRIEEHNVNNQIYGLNDVGNWKVQVLQNRMFRSLSVEVEAIRDELTEKNLAKYLAGSDVVVDTFDNTESRKLVTEHCREQSTPCLHAGLSADYGETIWNDDYRVPEESGQNICDYPLARNLVLLTVSVAAESLIRFAIEGRCENHSITLRDFSIRSLER